MWRWRFAFVLILLLTSGLKAQELDKVLEVKANACEKALEGESPSSVRVRAVDKAVFLGLKSLETLDQDKAVLNDHDLNVMIYRLVDDYVEDLSSKVTKSEEGKVCVEVSGYINKANIESVRAETYGRRGSQDDDGAVAEIAAAVNNEVKIKPQNTENLALVYVNDLVYYNGAKSKKYGDVLKDKIKDNPYYYLTDQEDLADYLITPKVLKAKVDALDPTHKRLQMVVALEVSGLDEDTQTLVQNRFILFSTEEDEQDIAARLIKKLLDAAGADMVRKIEHKEQLKLEQNTLGRTISE